MSRTPLPLRRALALAALAGAAVAACAELQAPLSSSETVDAPFLAAFTGYPGVRQVVVTITGPRIDPALVFNFPVVNDTARGTLTVPIGNNRLVVGQAFDSTGIEVLRGQRTISVATGTNPSLALVLEPVLGSLPVTAVIGNVTLTLTSAAASLRAGSTVALTAVVKDASGATITAPVAFAVSRPPAARVRADGLLLALDTGAVTVTATAFGRAASTALTLTAGTVLDALVFKPDSVVGSGSVEAVIAVRDNAGVDSLRLRTATPTGTAGPSCTANAPVRGSRTLGEFSCVLVFPAGSAAGRWPVTGLDLFAGANVAALDSVALRHRGAAAAVRNVP